MNLDFSLEPLFNKLQLWVDSLIKMLPNLIIAALVLVAGLVLTRFLKKYFHKLSRRVVSNNKTVSNLMSSVLTAVFMIFVIFLVLSILELEGTVRSLLAGAGVIGLAIGLAFQDPILNLFSGIIISTRGFFNVGDLIEVSDKRGIITRITLRSTFLRHVQGHEIIIPNKDVATNPIENLAAQSDAIMAIKQAYDANDIMIPFPIRTLDFGIKGGEKLSTMLNGSGGKQQNGNSSQPAVKESSTST